MFLIKTTPPDQARGKTREAYSVFPQQVPVPEPLVLMSASEDLVRLQSGILNHYINQERLDLGLLSSIRYVTAHRHGYEYCKEFNGALLRKAGGLTDEQLAAMAEDPSRAPLDEEQKALLVLAVTAATDPGAITPEDLDQLRGMGWTDKDVFEASYHATSMVSAGLLYRAFVR